MARLMTGNQMVESVRNRTMTPDDTSIFTDDNILDILHEEMTSQVLDKLIVLHGENLTISEDIPRNAKGEYEIPYRAVGNKLRDISTVSGGRLYELAQISIGELPDYSFNEGTYSNMDLFYVENNKVKLVNPSRSYDTIRIKYYLRPNYLTKVDQAGVISNIVIDENAGTVTFALSQVGRQFNSTEQFDIIGKRTPNKIKNFDLNAASLTVDQGSNPTGTIIFNLADIESIEDIIIGDYISLAQETPVPNIPTEMHPLLAQAAAVQLLEAMSDTEAFNTASKRLMSITKAVQILIDDRVELAPKKIKPRHGTLNQQIKSRRTKGSF